MRKTDAGGIGTLLPGHYLLLKPRKGRRALATAIGRLPKARVIKGPSNAPANAPSTCTFVMSSQAVAHFEIKGWPLRPCCY